jgi:hypothetical protein
LRGLASCGSRKALLIINYLCFHFRKKREKKTGKQNRE